MRFKERVKKFAVITTATALVVSSVQPNVNVKAAEGQPLGANVALGQSIIIPESAYTNADGSEDTGKKNNIPKIFDGNLTSGFQSVNTTSKEDPQEWIIDLGESYTIDKVKLYWENGARATVYDIYVSETNSENAEDWTLVQQITDGVAQVTCQFEAIDAQYVKLDLKTKTATWGYNLYEAEVYTVGSTEPAIVENLAQKATATASAYDGNNTADKAIDGNEGTMWQAPQNEKDENGADKKDENGTVIKRTTEALGSDYITLTWDEPQHFNVIKLVWGGGYVNKYKLQTSEDGETWKDIYEVTDAIGGETRTITLDQAVTTQYLRMQNNVTEANEVHYRDELKEFQVFDETNIPVEEVFINRNALKFNIDDGSEITAQLEAVVNPSNSADKSVTWESSNPEVASVDENGLVTALKSGIVTITVASVSNPEIKAECRVAVAGAIDKAVVTTEKIEGTKSISVSWNEVENAVSYELYRNDTEEAIYTVDAGEESYNFTDESLEPGTYSYYIKAIAPEDSDVYADSTSEVTDSILIPVDVTGVIISDTETDVYVGDSYQITATIEPDNATYKDVTWSSDNEEIVTVDENGNVTAVKEGTATITVTTVDGEFKATCTVNAIPVDAQSVTLNKDKETVELGDTVQLEVTVAPDNTTYKDITWTTADDTIATVDEEGLVTAIGVGTTVITATAVSGVTAEYEITVKITPTNVELNQTEVELYEGNTTTLSATVTPDDATDNTVTWSSDNETVATVDENGNITAVSAGTATITVKTNDGDVTATCIVTVKKEEVPTSDDQTNGGAANGGASNNNPTTANNANAGTSDNNQTTTVQGANVSAPAAGKIAKMTTKKKSSNKVKLSLKKISRANGYEVQILKTKKAKKALVKKTVKKVNVTIKSKKLKNKKNLFVKVRAYVVDANGNKVYGKWSAVKKVKIK